MKYILNSTNYHDFNIISDNSLKPRSYFIPYRNKEKLKETNILLERYSSSLVEILNGDWDFKFFKNPNDLNLEFDSETEKFDIIDVPSVWQFRNYDRPFYLNSRYQFPCVPPYIPTLDKVGKIFNLIGNGKILSYVKPDQDEYNFVGVYRKKINLDKEENKKYILSFLGVCSCFDLYVNGNYVGYAEGSHNMHEFDVSSYLDNSENEVLLVVRRWCNGSYLECQDMYRNNGIFRDVLLRKEEFLFDYQLDIKKVNNKYDLEVKVQLLKEASIKVSLEGIEEKESNNLSKEHVIKFTSLEVNEWNAETPNIYSLFISVISENKEEEVIRKNIGFKEVKIVKDKFYLNDHLIKVKGVNHHDTSYKNGYYLTPEEIEKDVLLCKGFNVNTIRTSHYPSDPLLLELCTIYGIYVIDEADLETHGCQMGTLNKFGLISNDPKWERHYLDRAIHLFERDKNESCIIMWSLGNEAGGYKNQDKMYEYFKSISDLPVHYESVVHSKRKAYDVGSQMYASIERVRSVGEHKCEVKQFNDRPYILCEYVHAMGVGPGGMKEYMDLFYEYDNLMGGCIWEMVDHAYLDEKGVYRYGGDFGEYMHDINFCVDGLFYPDRKPSTGAKIMKYEYRPLKFVHLRDNVFEIFNTNQFIDASSYNVEFIINNNKETRVLKCKPLAKEEFELPISSEEENIIYINVYKGDKLVSEESILVNYQVDKETKMEGNASLKDNKLVFDKGEVYLDKDNKLVIKYEDTKISYGEFGTLVFRTPTDNDLYTFGFKTGSDIIQQSIEVKDVTYFDNKIKVISLIKYKKSIFEVVDLIEVDSLGKVFIESTLIPKKGKKDILRFSKEFVLDKEYDEVKYFGRINESYVDMKDYSLVKEDVRKVKDMTEPNIRPQESGNRCDCKYGEFTNGKYKVRFTALEETFELGVKPYSESELIKMKHNDDEVISSTYINICKFNKGIGTGACGPQTYKEYRYYPDKEYKLKFVIEVGK